MDAAHLALCLRKDSYNSLENYNAISFSSGIEESDPFEPNFYTKNISEYTLKQYQRLPISKLNKCQLQTMFEDLHEGILL